MCCDEGVELLEIIELSNVWFCEDVFAQPFRNSSNSSQGSLTRSSIICESLKLSIDAVKLTF